MKKNSAKRRSFLCQCMFVAGALMWTPAQALAGGLATDIVLMPQQGSVKGKVVDESGEPLIGATVIVKGTTNGTITDFDGNFTLSCPPGSTLVISYTGFVQLEVEAKDNVGEIVLKENASQLDEVVVTGYGSQKKVSIVGSIETVKPAELKTGTTRSVSNNLAGKLSGVIAVQRSGEPGYDDSNFWIRGISTFSGNAKPLVLVDGVERDLNRVDVNEIESFSVLKDASASAMYGVRGANGVIIITTKHGQVGAPQVKFHVEHAITSPTKLPEFLNAPDHMELLNELAAENGEVIPFTQEQIDRTRSGYDPDLYPDVDWIGEITKDYAHTTRASMDVSGGSSYIRYSVVASYFGETGLLEQDKSLPIDNSTHNNQFNLRTNVDMDLTKTTLLRVNVGGYLQRFKKQRVNTDWVMSKAFTTLPFIHPIRYSDGSFPVVNYKVNPWYEATQMGYDFTTSSQIQTLFAIEQDLKFLTKGLKIKGMYSFDRYNSSRRTRTAKPPTVQVATARDSEGNLNYARGGTGDESMGFDTGNEYGNSNVYLEFDIMYNRKFGRSDVDAMFLYNQSSQDKGEFQEYRKQGIAGRLSYTFDNRYVGEFNFGYNGSENFDKGERFGFFPSFAVGWLLSEEPFMESTKDIFNKIKFRGSIGQAGSDNIGGRRFAYLTTLTNNDNWHNRYYFGLGGDRQYNGIREGDIGVTGLTWETVTKMNVGIELGIANFIDLTFDIFKDKRKDIFMQRKIIPEQTGFQSAPWANYGKMTNKGYEVSLNLHKQWNKDWFTSFYGNFTYAKNTVDEIDEAESRKGTYRSQTGRSYNELWGLLAERLFSYDDFDITTEADGTTKYTLKAGIPTQEYDAQIRPGDIKYVDRNGDGRIDGNDEGYIGGQEDPRIVYGFGGVVSYKNWDFNFFFQGVGDTYRIIGYDKSEGNERRPFFLPGGGTTTEGHVYSYNLDDRWTEDNQDLHAFWPRAYYGTMNNNLQQSSWWKKDMSFLRCKTLELGYTLPKGITSKIHSSSCRVYVSGNNLFCFSPFKLWDPEVSTGDGLQYPINRSILFGIDLNF